MYLFGLDVNALGFAIFVAASFYIFVKFLSILKNTVIFVAQLDVLTLQKMKKGYDFHEARKLSIEEYRELVIFRKEHVNKITQK